MTLHTQFLTMVAMIVGGLYLGFATATFRRVLYKWRHYMIVRFGLEVFYWMIQTCLLFYVLYRMNHGEIRLFLGLACLLGFSMYVVLCKSWYEKVLEVMITIVKTISSWTLHCINILILQPVMWLLHMLFSLMKFIYRVIVKIVSIVLYPFIFLLKKYLPAPFLNKVSKLPSFCSTIIDKLKGSWKKISKKWR